MKALQVSGEWKPRPGYTPTEREIKDKRAVLGSNIFYNPVLEFVEKPVPVPKEDEVLLKVGGAGVCGSDILFLSPDEDNYSMYCAHCKFPVVIGHEFSGEITAVGKNVTTLKVGDIVVAETMNWCGECMPCRTGLFNQCERLEEIGFTLDGAFAEYLVAKEKFCFSINELLDVYGTKQRALEVGALVEPTAVAYNGLLLSSGGFMAGGNVAVFGAGPIGLAAIMLAKTCGAAKIIAFEVSEPRAELARQLGADYVLNPVELEKQGSSPSEAIMKITKGVGVAIALEATHHQGKTIPEIEKSLAVGGKVAQLGIASGTTPMTSSIFQKKRASYHASTGSSGHGIWANVIRLIVSKRIDPSKMISKCYSLDDAIKAIEDAKNGTPGKNVVTPHW